MTAMQLPIRDHRCITGEKFFIGGRQNENGDSPQGAPNGAAAGAASTGMAGAAGAAGGMGLSDDEIPF